nr:hypothetical protein [Flavobacterium sp. ASV13]
MSLFEKTTENKKELYKLALEHFQNTDTEEYKSIKFNVVSLKSISILIDHNFIPTPCIEIKLEFLSNEKKTVNYFLYVDENNEFVDEFLIA